MRTSTAPIYHSPPVEDRPPPVFDDQAPSDRFCDLVLTGGVTSSIAYPPLLLTLASRFRFHSIGGSSSGAGAAALAAAAEYRRRHGSADGYRLLLERTSEVRRWVDETKGITGLRQLFQPWAHSRRLFDALVPAFTLPALSVGAIVRSLLRTYLLGRRGAGACMKTALVLACAGLVLMVVGAGIWLRAALEYPVQPSPSTYVVLSGAGAAVSGVIAWLVSLGAGVAGLLLGGLTLWRDVRKLVDDDFGLCGGVHPTEQDGPPPLTQWLHEAIQQIAGRSSDGPPLSFADLRDAPGAPRSGTQAGDVSIRLQIYSANITLGRPMVLPLRNEDETVYFLPREWRALLPEPVVRAAMRCRRDALSPGHQDDDEIWWEMPKKELPILVAARMSLSAPLLFAPVPVWLADPHAPSGLRRCLLSDGGLCSNFPIHMFDCAIPSWPTFGVAMGDAPREPGAPVVAPQRMSAEEIRAAVDLPTRHDQMPRAEWNRFTEEPSHLKRIGGFLSALAWTAKDWNDTLLSRMPGVRDRIVRIALPPGIGGLNIDMTPAQIQSLSDLGREAGQRLLERFARPGTPDGTALGWAEHRWVRLHLLREGLSELLAGAGASAAPGPYGAGIQQQIDHATDRAPLRAPQAEPLASAEAAALEGALAVVVAAEAALTAPAVAPSYRAKPQPVLRLRPPL